MRPNDYPEDPEGPPHNDSPVPAIALITWIQTEKEGVIEDLRDLIGRQGSKFGLEGGKPGQSGYYKNIVGGYEIREYWSPFVDGTGVIATVSAGDLNIVANSFLMLDHILKTNTQGAPTHPRLSERFEFRELLASSLPEANVVVWIDPQSAARTLRKQVRQWARDSIVVDWELERARFEQEVINELFPDQGKVRGHLTEEEQLRVDNRVEPLIDEVAARIESEQVPAVMAGYERNIVYSGGGARRAHDALARHQEDGSLLARDRPPGAVIRRTRAGVRPLGLDSLLREEGMVPGTGIEPAREINPTRSLV